LHAGSLGGAVAQDASQAAIGGCLFSLNKAQSQGGALYQSNTTGDVTTCTFANNTAANGGAVYQNLAQGE
jgi:predicted outer membrane repeat protein